MFSLNGKRALITGGTGGLGSAIAHAFLQQGADVAAAALYLCSDAAQFVSGPVLAVDGG